MSAEPGRGAGHPCAFRTRSRADGARIPTLADVLALGRRPAAGAVRFNIEIKSSPLETHESAGPEALALAVAAVLRTEGMIGRATVQSFDWRVLREMRAIAPEISIACLTSERGWRDTLLRGRAEPSPWTAGLGVAGGWRARYRGWFIASGPRYGCPTTPI